MIDSQLIDSAIVIRKEYLKLVSTLNKYQDNVSDLSKFLLEKIDDMSKYNNDVVKNIRTQSDITKVSDQILRNIQEIEDEEKKLSKKVNEINIKLEKLRSDETVLYNKIVDRYPNLSESEIIQEIQSRLDS